MVRTEGLGRDDLVRALLDFISSMGDLRQEQKRKTGGARRLAVVHLNDGGRLGQHGSSRGERRWVDLTYFGMNVELIGLFNLQK